MAENEPMPSKNTLAPSADHFRQVHFNHMANEKLKIAALVGHGFLNPETKKTPATYATGVFTFRSLAMTYSHMGKPHTTIGDEPFHY